MKGGGRGWVLRKSWRWGLVLLHSAAIFFASSRSDADLGPANFPGADKAAHVAIYLLWGWLFSGAFAASFPRRPRFRRVVVATVAGLFYGALDELHQSFVPGRECDITDLAADGVGACVGSLLSLLNRYRNGGSRSGGGAVPVESR